MKTETSVMTTILDGKATAATIRGEVAAGVAELRAAGKRPPGLAAVLVGEDPASTLYVTSKGRDREEGGVLSRTHRPAAPTGASGPPALLDPPHAAGAYG